MSERILGSVVTGLRKLAALQREETRRGKGMNPGPGTFKFGPGISVRYWLPEGFSKDDPILFVLPGIDRDARTYRDIWTPHASRKKALLLVPQFRTAYFPGSRGYNLGNMFDSRGRAIPRPEWSFARIEQIFDHAREAVGGAQTGYRIYGHSAGAQFVQRMMLFMPEARIERAVSANAGWYTFPDFNTEFPYGLGGTSVTEADLATVFARDFAILLGEEDTDDAHPTLRSTPEAQAQGANRFDRGNACFAAARAKAAELGVPFAWRITTVPGASHSNTEMAEAGARLLFDPAG